jgi:hypothetical protein
MRHAIDSKQLQTRLEETKKISHSDILCWKYITSAVGK